jgi:hypothetical protein
MLLALLLATSPAVAQFAKAFDDHPIVMLGELHRWKELHDFIQQLLHDPQFICRADDVVVELGNSRLQPLADRWVAGESLSEAQIQSLWRETAVPLTWNSPVYRAVLDAIIEIDRKHLCDHPVRIVLSDPPLDWSRIHTVAEYNPWTDRDGSMAAVIEREVLAKKHRAFFLAGRFHALKKSPDPKDPRAAALIEAKHPGAIFSVIAVPAKEPSRLEFKPAREVPTFDTLEDSQPLPTSEYVDAVLFVAPHTDVYPSPKIYLDPAYQKELRRRCAIHKEASGQDFLVRIDELVREAKP